MGDASMSIEHEVATGEQSRKPVVPETPKQEVLLGPGKVDLEAFYQNELTRYRAEQNPPGKRAWDVLATLAERNSRWFLSQEEESRHQEPLSMTDKLRRQAIFAQARIERVKNLESFKELVDYFESTVIETDYKYVKVPKGLTNRQKRAILEKQASKEWQGSLDSFREYDDKKHAELRLSHKAGLRIGTGHVGLIKNLVSSDNNPVELARGLTKMGFEFTKEMFMYKDQMKKLSQFFNAPHAKEALELAQGISKWARYDWFAYKDSSGTVDFLIQLAQNPDPKVIFPPDVIKKIDTLSKALNVTVEVRTIGELQTIMNNPDYLELASYIAQAGNYIYPEIGNVFENIVALDKANVLQPVLNLYRCGVAVDLNLIDRGVVQAFKDALNRKESQGLLQSPQKQEFVGLLGNLAGYPIPLKEISRLEDIFGEDFSRKKGTIYILKFTHANERNSGLYDDSYMKKLGSMCADSKLMDTFISSDFFVFLRTLQERAGYKPILDDFSSGELVNVFKNSEVRHGLVRDDTLEIVKAIHPDGRLCLPQAEVYIRLAQNPNMGETIKVLGGLGYDFSDYRPLLILEGLERNPISQDDISKLKSPELQRLSTRLIQEFKWKFRYGIEKDLLHLFDDKELQAQLFEPENIEFVKKIRPWGIYLSELKSMLALDSKHRELLVGLAELLPYSISTLEFWENREYQKVFDILLQNDQIKAKLFSKQTIEIFKMSLKDFDFHQFKTEEIISLFQLLPYVDKLPDTLATLEELGYQFDFKDLGKLVSVLQGNFSKERLIALKQVHDRYRGSLDKFSIDSIENAVWAENEQDEIERLRQYNYNPNIVNIGFLKPLLALRDKEKIFTILDHLRSGFPSFKFVPILSSYYVKLAQIPGAADKIREATASITSGDLLQENNFKLFVTLDADSELYKHASELLSDDYFKNIRDAQNRLKQFTTSMYEGKIPDTAVAKIFAVSQKATELDRLALKLGINAKIAKAANREDWHASLLQASNSQEANEMLTKMMADLAIPVIYSDLQGEELSAKQNELIELAGKDKEFDDILEIGCRSVGIYGEKYFSRGQEFDVLMRAIKHSLELNLERNPKAYLQKRAELSGHQFDRIFEGIPQDVKDRVMRTWLDLSSRRRLRVSGSVVTSQEATLNRLNRIKDVVQTDLSVHLRELFIAKIKELEQATEREDSKGLGIEQLAIYKQYLLTPEGEVRQDIPRIYRSVETFIRNTQAALKNPETPKEKKGKLGKSLGTYQGISDSLKALYRLGTISEKRYKARRDYFNEIEKHIGEFSGALKRLRILDPERRSTDVNMNALENEVLLDFGKLRETMIEEGVENQVIFETESTVAFENLARAPEMNQSCQRLTEVTGYNQAAYSRLLDASNEMIDIYELRNGEKNRLARSFIELSRAKITGEEQPRLAILIDREYVNPQYQDFTGIFSQEIITHMLDRIASIPEVSLLFQTSQIATTPEAEELLRGKGYRIRQVSGEYFINESNVKLEKYYDSMNGLTNVSQPSYTQFNNFYLIEKS